MNPEILIDTPTALALRFAERFAVIARQAIRTRGRVTFAVPGGSVAETFFPALVRAEVPWDRAEIFWVDERAVRPDHPDSNFGLAKELFLDPVYADPGRVHRIKAERPDLEAVARSYDDEMRRTLGRAVSIDVVLLGVGPEGHICSLFPGHPLLQEREMLAAAILDSPKPPPRRVTFTLRPLEEAGLICVAAFGASKAEAIRDALEDPGADTPLALALRTKAPSLVMLDPEAAGLLRRG